MARLSRKEQRGLRGIERGLFADDPRLARLLSEPTGKRPAPETTGPHAHNAICPAALRAGVSMMSMAILLLLGGLAAGERQMILGGVLVLGLSPLVVLVVLAAGRHDAA